MEISLLQLWWMWLKHVSETWTVTLLNLRPAFRESFCRGAQSLTRAFGQAPWTFMIEDDKVYQRTIKFGENITGFLNLVKRETKSPAHLLSLPCKLLWHRQHISEIFVVNICLQYFYSFYLFLFVFDHLLFAWRSEIFFCRMWLVSNFFVVWLLNFD